MDSDSSDPLFPNFNHGLSASASDSRRKRTKVLITPTTDRRLAPSTSAAAISKPKCVKKPDPTAPKITRPCSECGKKFWSWKALFGHMRCHPERQWRGINPPPNLRRPSNSACPAEESGSTATEEDHEVATCLIMLSNGGGGTNAIEAVTETDDEEYREIQESETATATASDRFAECAGPPSCRFECSSCKKVFGSHQALGGHRASHKNVKGCFAVARTDNGGGTAEEYCSVCVLPDCEDRHRHRHRRRRPNSGCLDLNLPPPMEDIEESSSSHSCSGIVLDLRLGLN